MVADLKQEIVIGASSMLDVLKSNPKLDLEKSLMIFLKGSKGMKREVLLARIAGASRAFSMKEKNPRLEDKKIYMSIDAFVLTEIMSRKMRSMC